MVVTEMSKLYLVWFITFILSISIEYFTKPSPPKFYRTYTTYILHFSIISLFYITIVFIVQRPIFASLFVLITQIIFVIISNAKYKALKEPLVFSDIVMFSQAFKYPRLYFPFLGWLPLIGAPTLIISAIIWVLRFEPSLSFNHPLLIFFIFISIIFIYHFSLKQEPSLNIVQDIQQIGFIASLVSYEVLSRQGKHKKQIANLLQVTQATLWSEAEQETNREQDIIVIQSESFFDARRLHPSVSQHVLKNFDRCCAESLHYGQLNVAAWGANTMRTEFSFLSGIDFEDMGFYRFYPYYYIRHYQLTTFAHYLQKKGYYCICIHPHHAGFFGRKDLFPQLGFDEFIDISAFNQDDKDGPYISDKAVSEKIIERLTLKANHKPCFIFAITMENHGPLHLEKASSEDKKKYYTGMLPPDNTEILSIYLRHLENADKMIGSLMTTLKNDNKNTLLCLYGDHVPSMPEIYAETGFNDNRTEYVIWSSAHIKKNSRNKKDIAAQCLAQKIKNSLSP